MASSAIPVIDFRGYSIDVPKEALNASLCSEVDRSIYHAFTSVGFVYLRNHGIQQEKSEWPEKPPSFRPAVAALCEDCEKLTWRVLTSMAKGLGLQDESYFCKNHDFPKRQSMTTMRLLQYPPVPDEVKPGQTRFFEHWDYGSIKLLFQDDAGGLEVLRRDGTWVPATPIPGTVLVNIGEVMQRWTADKFVATRHRVVIPDEEASRRKVRRSIAFFGYPDKTCMIECLDGSNKYKAISAQDYLPLRFGRKVVQ